MGVHYNIFYFGVLEGFSIMKYLSDFFLGKALKFISQGKLDSSVFV